MGIPERAGCQSQQRAVAFRNLDQNIRADGGQQCDELVASPSSDKVGGAKTVRQRPGGEHQNRVSNVMAMPIINLFEPINVGKQQAEGHSMLRGLC